VLPPSRRQSKLFAICRRAGETKAGRAHERGKKFAGSARAVLPVSAVSEPTESWRVRALACGHPVRWPSSAVASQAQPPLAGERTALGWFELLAANSCFTDSRIKTMIVKTPSTVPKGIKRQSTPAMTRQNK
jgi:hypothetical protein